MSEFSNNSVGGPEESPADAEERAEARIKLSELTHPQVYSLLPELEARVVVTEALFEEAPSLLGEDPRQALNSCRIALEEAKRKYYGY